MLDQFVEKARALEIGRIAHLTDRARPSRAPQIGDQGANGIQPEVDAHNGTSLCGEPILVRRTAAHHDWGRLLGRCAILVSGLDDEPELYEVSAHTVDRGPAHPGGLP